MYLSNVAKGIEEQTRKALRGLPLARRADYPFVNKLDREGRARST
jgi:peptide subunit release factor RF-3